MINRRSWLRGLALALGATASKGTAHELTNVEGTNAQPGSSSQHLALADYEPKSMLQVHESRVERARFPAVDVHTHISVSAKAEKGIELASARTYLGTSTELLAVMDQKNIRAMVNLTGGFDDGLVEAIGKYDKAFPGRFYTFAEPSYSRFLEPSYPKLQADAIEQAHRAGARGLKILKTLGLYLRENITSGKLVKIDDPRFDPMWDACGQLNMPVAIHVSDLVKGERALKSAGWQ